MVEEVARRPLRRPLFEPCLRDGPPQRIATHFGDHHWRIDRELRVEVGECELASGVVGAAHEGCSVQDHELHLTALRAQRRLEKVAEKGADLACALESDALGREGGSQRREGHLHALLHECLPPAHKRGRQCLLRKFLGRDNLARSLLLARGGPVDVHDGDARRIAASLDDERATRLAHIHLRAAVATDVRDGGGGEQERWR